MTNLTSWFWMVVLLFSMKITQMLLLFSYIHSWLLPLSSEIRCVPPYSLRCLWLCQAMKLWFRLIWIEISRSVVFGHASSFIQCFHFLFQCLILFFSLNNKSFIIILIIDKFFVLEFKFFDLFIILCANFV